MSSSQIQCGSMCLARVPGSVLLLLTSSHHHGGGVEFNLKAEAAARGVHPERIMLDKKLPRAEHIWVSHVVGCAVIPIFSTLIGREVGVQLNKVRVFAKQCRKSQNKITVNSQTPCAERASCADLQRDTAVL